MKIFRSLSAVAAILMLVATGVPAVLTGVPVASAQAAPTLSVEIDAPDGILKPGGYIRYSIRFINNTTTEAKNVGFGFQDPAAPGRNYGLSSSLSLQVAGFPGCAMNANHILVCGPLASIAPGQTHSFIIQFQISANAPCGEELVAALDVGATGFAGNWSRIVRNTVSCTDRPQMSIIKTPPASVQPGGTATYTFIAKNTGTAAAQNVVAYDFNIDAQTGQALTQLTFPHTGSAGAPCAVVTLDGRQVVKCTLGTFQPNEERTFTVSFSVPNDQNLCNKTVKNQVDVWAGTDQNSSAWATASTTVTCQSTNVDLSVSKTGPSTVTRGTTATNVSYTLTASNAGPAKATGVVVRDPVPAGLTYNAGASSTECVLVGSDVKCMNFDLDAGQSRTFTVVFTAPAVDPNVCQQTTITNVANIFQAAAGGQTDTNPNNNQSQTVTTTLTCPQNGTVTIAKTDNRTTAAPGEVLQYVITLTNTSSVAATAITVTDTLPSGVTFLSASHNGQLNGQTVTWTNGGVPANSSVTLTLQARVSDGLTNGSVLVNTATIVGGSSATDTTIVQTSTSSQQLRVELTDSPDPIQCDERLTYTVRVFNDTATTQTATVRLRLSDDVDFRSASDSGDEDDGVVLWRNATFNANSSRSYTVTVVVSDDEDICDGATLTSRVSIDSYNVSDEEDTDVEDEEGDPECDDGDDNDDDGDTDYPDDDDCDSYDDDSEDGDDDNGNGDASVTVQKFADRTEVRSGEQVYYTITIRNNSDETAEDLEVVDLFPAHMLSLSNTAGAESVAGGIRWRISKLLEGETRTITYSAAVAGGLTQGTVIQNTVGVRGDNVEPSYANATVTVASNFVTPQTGLNDGTGPLENTRRFLSPFGNSAAGAGLPAGMWASLLLTGLSAGGWIARKYFL